VIDDINVDTKPSATTTRLSLPAEVPVPACRRWIPTNRAYNDVHA
jgi:hypothetical protein